MIKLCTCTSDSKNNPAGAQFQDAKYGKGMRVFTGSGGGESSKAKVQKSRCTVCGQESK